MPKSFTIGRKGNDKRRFLIVGGGVAGLTCAETLRQAGFEGEITIISKEKELPYNRTVLSKNIFGAEISRILLRDKKFFDDHDINVLSGTEVTNVDYSKKFV